MRWFSIAFFANEAFIVIHGGIKLATLVLWVCMLNHYSMTPLNSTQRAIEQICKPKYFTQYSNWENWLDKMLLVHFCQQNLPLCINRQKTFWSHILAKFVKNLWRKLTLKSFFIRTDGIEYWRYLLIFASIEWCQKLWVCILHACIFGSI